jgi:hypothetical protein
MASRNSKLNHRLVPSKRHRCLCDSIVSWFKDVEEGIADLRSFVRPFTTIVTPAMYHGVNLAKVLFPRGLRETLHTSLKMLVRLIGELYHNRAEGKMFQFAGSKHF